MPTSVFSDNIRNPKPLSEDLLFLNLIQKSYPSFTFRAGKKFLFRPPKSIEYNPEESNFQLLLLHELSHAILGHFSYKTSIERLKIERDAWDKTRELCKKHSVSFLEQVAEAELSTYRDWVHQKTLCKTCGISCLEINSESLFCPLCQKYYKK